MASLLAALLTLTCLAVSFASAGGGALFSGPALLEVSGLTAAPKGEAGEEAAGFAVDEGAADVEFAAGFAPAAAIWRATSETDVTDGT